jgi:hypothetical protein
VRPRTLDLNALYPLPKLLDSLDLLTARARDSTSKTSSAVSVDRRHSLGALGLFISRLIVRLPSRR